MSKNKLSLQETHPQVADQWHPGKNGGLTPDQVVAGSHKKFWWKCDKGPDHEWDAIPSHRTGRGHGCPCCAGLKVSVTNSLASLHPELAEEWHPNKNGDLKPNQVVAGSHKQVWWKCDKGPDGEMRPHWTEEDEKRRREQKEKKVRISAFNRYRSRHRFTSNWFSWIDLFNVTR